MKKPIIILVLFLLLIPVANTKAQQLPKFTQFMFNPYLLNPAIAGTFNYYQIRSGHRFQWSGFDGYPVTNVISVYGPLEKQPMGLGGVIYHDVVGVTSQLGARFSYAYNYPINPQYKISGGLSLGMLQYSLDATELEFFEPEQQQQKVLSQMRPDASVGVYLYSANFNFGISADQIFRPKLEFEITDSTSGDAFTRLVTHFYIMSGYKYFINRDWAIEPSLIVKKVQPAPFQLDFNVRGIYQNMVWAGVSGRTSEGIAFLLGYIHENRIYAGFSYDLTLNEIGRYSNGTYEIMIGYKFNPIKN
ncbi:MAG: type IX secretion system membrane protein PorP/SprF [Bacteroidetes bacterium]|jgi:type IX secretion system PorP/SprF family membrane protein|nr:type IX secretion system membrane protein PorP/SprF [Bacteroidota bacterium]